MESIALLKWIIWKKRWFFHSLTFLRLAFSGVEPTPSHYKYNKTFHSAADFP
jgi:hypothetical protein